MRIIMIINTWQHTPDFFSGDVVDSVFLHKCTWDDNLEPVEGMLQAFDLQFWILNVNFGIIVILLQVPAMNINDCSCWKGFHLREVAFFKKESFVIYSRSEGNLS